MILDSTKESKENQSKNLKYPGVLAIAITLVLAFADEGNYDFSWMQRLENFLALGSYFLGYFCVFYFLSKFLAIKLNGLVKWVLVLVLGIPLGCILAFAFMMLLSPFFSFLQH